MWQASNVARPTYLGRRCYLYTVSSLCIYVWCPVQWAAWQLISDQETNTSLALPRRRVPPFDSLTLLQPFTTYVLSFYLTLSWLLTVLSRANIRMTEFTASDNSTLVCLGVITMRRAIMTMRAIDEMIRVTMCNLDHRRWRGWTIFEKLTFSLSRVLRISR